MKMSEYHVDTYHQFIEFNPSMSIRCDLISPHVMISGQDESYFKHHSFLKHCWVWPCGEMKLLPKTDDHTQIVLTFCSCTFSFGLELNNEELKEVNERRQGDEWNAYISSQESYQINGTNKKWSKIHFPCSLLWCWYQWGGLLELQPNRPLGRRCIWCIGHQKISTVWYCIYDGTIIRSRKNEGWDIKCKFDGSEIWWETR